VLNSNVLIDVVRSLRDAGVAVKQLKAQRSRTAPQALTRSWPSKSTTSERGSPPRRDPVRPDSISIIGCDAANRTYVQLYSDQRGVCRIYTMRMDGRQWTLQREGDPFAQRFIATISDDGRTIAGRWEKADADTEFTVDFHLTYRKTESPKG